MTSIIGLLATTSGRAQQVPPASPVPKVAAGKIDHLTNFSSRLTDPRNVEVWLPPGHSPAHRYPVVYMHDGQMLFDSTATWNHQEWHVDEVLGRPFQGGQVPPCIVVGIWNNGALRHAEYFPQAPQALMTPATRADLEARKFKHAPLADKCLQFLVTELKPYIDAHYATAKARENTFLMGSSMGGLISLYGLCEYPQVFGGAECLSMHSPMTSPALINN